jgi:SAM-dependent methyltransferase
MGYVTSRNRLTERTVEVPWVLEHLTGEPVLDIGSSGADYLHLLPPGSVATDIRPLAEAHLRDDCTFRQCSVTALPFASGTFAQVLLVSTLEHVGCFSAHYGTQRASDIARAQWDGLRECLRVTKPGGSVLLTVPYGKAEDLGWQLVYDRAMLEDLVAGHVVELAEFYLAEGDGPYFPCLAADCDGVPYQYEEGGSRAAGVALLVIRKPGRDDDGAE